MCMRVLPVCMSMHYTTQCVEVRRGQASDPVDLELQTVVSCKAGAGN